MTSQLSTAPDRRRTVFVTGASGYIGAAVCRAFVRAGWKTFGFIRRPEAAKELIEAEAIPVIGTFTDHGFLGGLYEQANTFDVIVSCTEQLPGYAAHFDEVLGLVKALADTSNSSGVKPLVLWSSGCKDYGTTPVHGASDLAPHTEESPLNGPDLLQERTSKCMTIFDHSDSFDGVVLRPTNVFGYSSSYYGAMFSYAASEAARGAKVLEIPADPNSVMHGMHVDDCAEAYVALAEHADRTSVAGQAFNISAHRYETTGEIGAALAKEYGFKNGVKFVPMNEAADSFPGAMHFVFSFSQWVGSDKIRQLTGWKDRRAPFSEDVSIYRTAYDVMNAKGDFNIAAVRNRMLGTFSAGKI